MGGKGQREMDVSSTESGYDEKLRYEAKEAKRLSFRAFHRESWSLVVTVPNEHSPTFYTPLVRIASLNPLSFGQLWTKPR